MLSRSSESKLCCSRSSDKTQTSFVAACTADPFARERDSDLSLGRTKGQNQEAISTEEANC